MPRLSRAQKEAKEAKRAAIMAQRAADLQTSYGASSSSSKAPPPPSASALSTNQPLKSGLHAGATQSNLKERSTNDDEEQQLLVEHHRSRSSGTPHASSRRQEASSSVVPASPVAMASDMSTSGESDLELETGAGGDASRANISLVDEHADGDEDDELGGGEAGADESSPEVKCMWEDCGQVFSSLAPFINHLHEEHVGIHKARYACEWTGCPRKGKGQTSRFALLSHLRSHTGEKPFTCPRPECDKSFTRSDALAKHMRVQHNINPVTTRGRNAANVSMTGAGRGGRMRGDADDDDWSSALGDGSSGAHKGADVVGEELLELVEGEANGSLVNIEQSLLMLDSKSPFFTYDNLFGAGARALAHLSTATGKKGDVVPSYGSGPMPDAELGIVRDHGYGAGLSTNEIVRDDEAIAREENELAKTLEAGRREWVLRERERGELQREAEAATTNSKRDQTIDYLSDDEVSDGDTSRRSKRARRSSTRFMQKKVESMSEVASLKKLYVIEKAKLRWIRQENERMRVYLAELRQVERQEMLEKRSLLEKTLEAELGKDVSAIFSPPGSPGPADV